MDIKRLILDKIKEKRVLTVSEVAREIKLSRVYIHRFFKELVDEGKIAMIGHANRTRYVLAESLVIKEVKKNTLSFDRTFKAVGLREDQVFDLIKKETGILDDVSGNVSGIVEFAFTEMLNNAISHSRSEKIKTSIKRTDNLIRFDIFDWGIGIFENLIHSRHLRSVDEAIQDLLKGKQTTAPEEHSGEGIFFTRRVADTFVIRSSNKKLFFDNNREDFTIVAIKLIFGTRITFTISDQSTKELSKIFNKYTNRDYEFNTTEVLVKLYQEGEGRTFVSRSQAKRILYGLDKFQKIVLDFKNITAIGQGFADEVFRVWKNKYPKIEILTVNTCEEVLFMIERAKKYQIKT